MPTYRYECTKCKKVHEVFHAMSDPPLAKCPDCRGRVERLISGGAGVILKGSGFHNTDYRSKNWKSAESKEKSSSTPDPPAAKSDAPAAAAGSTPPKSEAPPSKSESPAKKKKKT